MTKINKKRPGLAHFKKNNFAPIADLCLTEKNPSIILYYYARLKKTEISSHENTDIRLTNFFRINHIFVMSITMNQTGKWDS